MSEESVQERTERKRPELRPEEQEEVREEREELREEREELREERELRRSLLVGVASYLGFADLMAVLMVAATGISAFATWRTATIARDLLMSSQRPYFGVHAVMLDRSRPDEPRMDVDYRNFGYIPADDVRLQVTMFIDGQALAANALTRNAGILSPDVPHHVFLRIPKGHYADVLAGRDRLLAQVSAWYNSGKRSFCYRERYVFMPDSQTFEIDGGSSRCDSIPPRP